MTALSIILAYAASASLIAVALGRRMHRIEQHEASRSHFARQDREFQIGSVHRSIGLSSLDQQHAPSGHYHKGGSSHHGGAL